MSDRDAILERLGLCSPPPIDPEGLAALYLGWCRTVPFDNVRKRIAIERGPAAPLPGLEPGDYFGALLAHGAGATCWPSANAMHWLLTACGFDARRVAATMEPMPFAPDDPVRPNHGTVVVAIDGGDYLLDNSMLSESPVPLRPGEHAAMADPVVGVDLEPAGETWRGRFMPWRPEGMLPCVIEKLHVDEDLFVDRYEFSRNSGRFNDVLNVRRNFADRVEVLALGQHFVIERPSGAVTTAEPVASRSERDRILVDALGFSEEIVAALPPDRPGGAPPR